MQGFSTKSINAAVFDDPNILVGNNGESRYTNLAKVRYIVRNQLPWKEPPKKGEKILRDWLFESHAGQRWLLEWQHLADLKMDDYIRIFSEFPRLFFKDFIGKKHKGYSIHESMANEHKAIASWLLWLTSSDRRKPKELEQETMQTFELDALISHARLKVCQQVISHQDFKYGELFHHNPACLWLWCEASQCTFNLEKCGLFKPVKRKDAIKKRQIHEISGKYLSYLQETANHEKINFVKITGLNLREILKNLLGIVDNISAKIASKNIDFRDAFHEPYLKLRHSRRKRRKDSENFQHVYLREAKNTKEPELFITGKRRLC